MNSPIEILCTANEGYARLLVTMIKSLLESADKDTKYRVHAIDHKLPCHVVVLIESYFEDSNSEIVWIDGSREALQAIYPIPPAFFELPGAGHYDRLLAPYLVEGDKALYLDCDLWIQGDLRPLWQIGTDGLPFAAVQDQVIPTIDAETGVFDWKQKGLNPKEEYFNSGILLLDLDLWRSESLFTAAIDIALEFIAEFEGPPPLHDQYVLNVLAHARWKQIGQEWNQFSDKIETASKDAFIVHFAGAHKPYFGSRASPASTKYFIRIAEGATKEELAEAEALGSSYRALRHQHGEFGKVQNLLHSPNRRLIGFAPATALAKASDEGSIVATIPAMISRADSDRWRNFEVLLRYYLRHCEHVVVAEQLAQNAQSPISELVKKLSCDRLHHITITPADDQIHKCRLINDAATLAFSELGARYVWQVDADILSNAAATIQQLSCLNSKAVPVVRPMFFFKRLAEEASEQVRLMSDESLDELATEEFKVSPFQVIDLFGPGSVVFSKSAFEETGGMNVGYTGWGWEDIDFGERLQQYSRPHTLPLIGIHLHHEEDRMPNIENFNHYRSEHYEESPDEERQRRRELAHTTFHNFLSKFCIVASTTREEIRSCVKKLSKCENVSLLESPIQPSSLLRGFGSGWDFTERIIQSFAASAGRHAGTQIFTDEPVSDSVTKGEIPLHALIDFFVSSGFRLIFVEESEQQQTHVTRTRKRFMETFFSESCLQYGRSPQAIALTTKLDDLLANPDETVRTWARHLGLSH